MHGGAQECGIVCSMCGGQKLMLSDFLNHSPPYTLRQGLFLQPRAQGFSYLARQLAPECWMDGPPHPPNMLVGSGHLNSSPHTCMTSTLPTRPPAITFDIFLNSSCGSASSCAYICAPLRTWCLERPGKGNQIFPGTRVTDS